MTARDILLDVRLAHLPLWMITSLGTSTWRVCVLKVAAQRSEPREDPCQQCRTTQSWLSKLGFSLHPLFFEKELKGAGSPSPCRQNGPWGWSLAVFLLTRVMSRKKKNKAG